MSAIEPKKIVVVVREGVVQSVYADDRAVCFIVDYDDMADDDQLREANEQILAAAETTLHCVY